ncbi:MAG TPA: TonB-dependent receptor [Blastocatellia bacterium]|nr:TonB-dependent receptor [Blastocatellia bacterium]
MKNTVKLAILHLAPARPTGPCRRYLTVPRQLLAAASAGSAPSGRWLGLLVAILLLVSIAKAQTFRGTILGTVTDANGAVVSGATVKAKDLATGLDRITTTDAAGNYSIPELPIGTYDLSVEGAGFQISKVSGVLVQVAGERRVDFALVASGAAVNVVIHAETLQTITTGDTLGGTIGAKQIAELPINGRDFTKLLVLAPGATGDPSGATDSPGSFGLFSSNGNRGRANNYLLDGTDMNDGYRNLPAINEAGVFGTPATILPVEAIAEAAVLSDFEAEYGRNSGAVVNMVTKSGTNEIHGSAFEFFRNNALDARNYFNPLGQPQTAFRNNQFGAALGGPIIRNRTFWFFSYEGQRERVGLNSVARVPDPAEIAADGGAQNPVIAALLARNPWPLPNHPVPLFDPSPNLFVTTPATNSIDSLIGKIDHSFNERNQLTGRYFYGNSTQSFPLALLGGNVLPGFNTVTPTRVQLVSISYLEVLSPAKVNEVRFGYNRFAEGFFPQDQAFDPRSIGLNTGASNPQDFGLPFIRIMNFPQPGSSVASLGATLSVPRGRIDTNWQALDNFSWKLDKHDVKLGYEFRRTFVNGFFDAGYRGRIDFASLQDFLQGVPSGGRAAQGDSRRGTFENSQGAYVQDSFHWTSRLTLNAGLRYDYFGVIGEERNRLSTFDPRVGLIQVGTNGLDSLYNKDFHNFSPRIGLAWDISGKGKTVVRAGWGIFYDAFSQDFFVGQLPFNTLNPGPAYNAIGQSPILFSSSTVSHIQPGVPVFTGFGATDAFSVDRNLRTPYVQNFNLNIQRELFKGAILQAGYVGSHGTKLFRYRDINQPPNPSVSTARPFDNGPFAPDGETFFYVNQIETTANSFFNSLQASLAVRDKHGFSTMVNYTWSHSIDNASDGQDYVANATQPDNSFRPDLERASSNFDNRQRLVWALNYQVPNLWRDHPKLGSGWELNGILTLKSGSPFNVNFFDDYNGTGEFFPRPDLVGNPYAGTHSPSEFLNLSAFAVPCTLDGTGTAASNCIPHTQHFGSLGRNALVGPGYNDFDMSLFKMTSITERLKLQFRAEVFNIFNHPNFSSPLLPGFSADASTGGIDPKTGRGMGFLPITVTPDVGIGNPFLGGGGSRNIQLALKLVF